MKENTISKVIRGFGWFFIFGGILTAVITGIAVKSWGIFSIILLCTCLSGIILIGFAEVINLLQLNVYKTEKLINAFSEQNKTFHNEP